VQPVSCHRARRLCPRAGSIYGNSGLIMVAGRTIARTVFMWHALGILLSVLVLAGPAYAQSNGNEFYSGGGQGASQGPSNGAGESCQQQLKAESDQERQAKSDFNQALTGCGEDTLCRQRAVDTDNARVLQLHDELSDIHTNCTIRQMRDSFNSSHPSPTPCELQIEAENEEEKRAQNQYEKARFKCSHNGDCEKPAGDTFDARMQQLHAELAESHSGCRPNPPQIALNPSPGAPNGSSPTATSPANNGGPGASNGIPPPNRYIPKEEHPTLADVPAPPQFKLHAAKNGGPGTSNRIPKPRRNVPKEVDTAKADVPSTLPRFKLGAAKIDCNSNPHAGPFGPPPVYTDSNVDTFVPLADENNKVNEVLSAVGKDLTSNNLSQANADMANWGPLASRLQGSLTRFYSPCADEFKNAIGAMEQLGHYAATSNDSARLQRQLTENEVRDRINAGNSCLSNANAAANQYVNSHPCGHLMTAGSSPMGTGNVHRSPYAYQAGFPKGASECFKNGLLDPKTFIPVATTMATGNMRAAQTAMRVLGNAGAFCALLNPPGFSPNPDPYARGQEEGERLCAYLMGISGGGARPRGRVKFSGGNARRGSSLSAPYLR
jgi:hypothetical protein